MLLLFGLGRFVVCICKYSVNGPNIQVIRVFFRIGGVEMDGKGEGAAVCRPPEVVERDFWRPADGSPPLQEKRSASAVGGSRPFI